jgi:hypothetical protein
VSELIDEDSIHETLIALEDYPGEEPHEPSVTTKIIGPNDIDEDDVNSSSSNLLNSAINDLSIKEHELEAAFQ